MSDGLSEGNGFQNSFENLQTQAKNYERMIQIQLDRVVPFSLYRWTGTWIAFLLFAARILLGQSHYIIAYAVAIYLLNLFLAFLQPKFDPSLELDIAESELEEAGGSALPTSSPMVGPGGGPNGTGGKDDGEFRPFIRRLPEFKFWLSSTRAILISLFLTLFEFTDVPVYWPILLMYFCILFALTMRRQIAHMRKYRYLPWDIGRKTTYGR